MITDCVSSLKAGGVMLSATGTASQRLELVMVSEAEALFEASELAVTV